MAPLSKRKTASQRGGKARAPRFSRLKEVVENGRSEDNRDSPSSSDVEEEAVPDSPTTEDESSDDDDRKRHGRNGPASYSILLKSLDVTKPAEPAQKKQKLEHTQNNSTTGEDVRLEGHSPTSNHGGSDKGLNGSAAKNNKKQAPQPDEAQDSDDDDESDPFVEHFENIEEHTLAKKIKLIRDGRWQTDQIESTALGRMSYTHLDASQARTSQLRHPIQSLRDVKLKTRLVDSASPPLKEFNGVQSAIAPALFSYTDVLFGGCTPSNTLPLRTLTCLHILNHLLKTRSRILKNTTRLAKNNASTTPDPNLQLRDQGFTRPKILILLETREACVRYMDTITNLFSPEQVENKKRFTDAFVGEKGRFSSTDKPADFIDLFDGNDDNDFRLGVKFTRKTLKYYSQFYASDIIFASPLGLRRAMKLDDPKHSDRDFLSSIEILVIEQADAMLMQNWEHVEHALASLNLQPKDSHGCDFSRVRQWYLDDNAKYLRQTIVFSAYLTPELNALFASTMLNIAGRIKAAPTYPGAITTLPSSLQIRQVFSRIHCEDPTKDPDLRFKYFISAVLPSLSRHRLTRTSTSSSSPAQAGLGILLFIPSYFDFLRLRQYFTSESTLSFGTISEYSDDPSTRRARSHFLTGRHDILLYTGRAHHFRRYARMGGVKQVVFYGVPENAAFYGELVGGFLGGNVEDGKVDAGVAGVRVLFSRWDRLALERVVGSERVGRMVREGAGDVFEFR